MFVGINVHRNRTQVCLLEDDGAEVYNRNVPNDQARLVELLGELKAGTPVVFEAAYGAAWVAELLEDLCLEPHLAHPSGCKAIASAKLKYDKLDARTLANLLRTGYLAEAWLAPPEVRDQHLLLPGHPMTTEVCVELEELAGSTKMVMTNTGFPADSPGAAGWAMAVDKLVAHIATLGA
jgi:hypothetical protein